MELPSRPPNDRFVKPGRFSELCRLIPRAQALVNEPTLLVSAFDQRTRMLPFFGPDRWIVPAGIRAVSAALTAAGFRNQRVVNQAWTPNVLPSQSRINGKLPSMLLVSSMQIHSAAARKVMRDAWTLGADRPLIISGGPKAIYQPWDLFEPASAEGSPDIVCTGEEFVLLELFERLSHYRTNSETTRQAFERARREGALDDIPGLMFEKPDRGPSDRELVSTGVQRLVRDFDELPMQLDGYRYLEPPHRGTALKSAPVPIPQVRKHCRIASILTTRGCKFRCGYCPIPAYNQFSFRTRSPDRLVEDIAQVRRELGISYFFGTDDNFFNDEKTVVDTFEAIAKADFPKDDIGTPIRFGTEATIFDVHKQLDVLPLAYKGGLRAIWFGIEDLTAELINKGQSVAKTELVFQNMRANRMLPMAMMMHYDGQPLYTRNGMDGIINQVNYLFKIGAGSVQVTVLGPAAGTKDYDDVLNQGIILKRIGNTKVDDCVWDGNHVISVGNAHPWTLQRNMLLAYATFYNPINFLRVIFGKQRKWSDTFLQLWGMYGWFVTSCRLVPWMLRLLACNKKDYDVYESVPESRLPITVLDSGEPESVADRASTTGVLHVLHGEHGSATAVALKDPEVVQIALPAKATPSRRSTLTKY